MKLKTCILFLLFSFTQSFATIPSATVVRNLYQKAATQADSCKKLVSVLRVYNENNNPLLGAYKACAIMAMANHVVNPYTKLSNFTEGKNLLEKCINTNNESIELRFLRFSVQSEAPSFLRYNDSIKKDKIFLINSISKISDPELKKLIVSFLKRSKHLTQKEKQNIK